MVAPRKLNERLTEWKGKARVEQGPALRKAKATKELLHDEATAAHYHEGAIDARGQKIALGKEIHYLDYRGEHGFYVYEYKGERAVTYDERSMAVMNGEAKAGDPVMKAGTDEPLTVEDWEEVGYFDSREEAEAEAERIVAGGK